ncbi:MAG: hypothetical protein LBH92_05630 [Bacteroidales bacterium]|jgi:cell division protein FtsB|nr:hypothetical protein [Bacteroidales bacterium]
MKKRKANSKSFLKRRYTKYLIVVAFFLFWMIIFDKHNIFRQITIRNDVQALKEENLNLRHELDSIRIFNDMLERDISKTEKLAREKYTVKREDEEVYLIIRE